MRARNGPIPALGNLRHACERFASGFKIGSQDDLYLAWDELQRAVRAFEDAVGSDQLARMVEERRGK